MFDFAQNHAGWQRAWVLRWVSTLLLLFVSLATSSCLFQKKPPRAFTPPPVAARVPPDSKPLVLPPPPESSTDVGPGEQIRVTSTGQPPLPAPPKPEVVKVTPPSPPPAVPNPPPVETPPPASPKPVQIYTADERQAFLRELNDSLGRVQQALTLVENRSLNADQQSIVNRIRTFQQQALQQRDQDLVAAVNLARRADLLARDLLGRLP